MAKTISLGKDIFDYKFFCFNGKPMFFKVDFGRFEDHHANYYNLDWNLLPFGEKNYCPVPSAELLPPPYFDKMISIATKLSSGHKFIRVDLYNVGGRIYFGEMTFYPASGFGGFTSEIADYEIGKYLELSNEK